MIIFGIATKNNQISDRTNKKKPELTIKTRTNQNKQNKTGKTNLTEFNRFSKF